MKQKNVVMEMFFMNFDTITSSQVDGTKCGFKLIITSRLMIEKKTTISWKQLFDDTSYQISL